MSLIATINGKKVYSDKQVAVINNSRVIFTDGSWCDVLTGQVHNASSGYINIGGDNAPESDTPVTEGPQRVNASALRVRNIAANVRVETHRESYIEYTISGAADDVKAITVSVRSDTLVIESDGLGRSGSNHTVIQSGGGYSVISSAGSVHIGGVQMFGGRRGTTTISTGDGESAVTVTLKVPEGTSVSSDGVLGTVHVGDTLGPLNVRIQGGSKVFAGRVTDTQLSVQGSGRVKIEEVTGSVSAHIQGSGRVVLKDGAITSLSATVQGSGRVKIGGSADTATLNVMGSGDIDIAHVKQRPMKNVMGSGDITVGRIG